MWNNNEYSRSRHHTQACQISFHWNLQSFTIHSIIHPFIYPTTVMFYTRYPFSNFPADYYYVLLFYICVLSVVKIGPKIRKLFHDYCFWPEDSDAISNIKTLTNINVRFQHQNLHWNTELHLKQSGCFTVTWFSYGYNFGDLTDIQFFKTSLVFLESPDFRDRSHHSEI